MTFSFKPKRLFTRRVGTHVATVALSVGLTLTALRVCPNLIPSRAVSAVSTQSETAPEPFVGIQIHDVTPQLARRMNDSPNTPFFLPETYGGAIAYVVPESPAAQSGLSRGDVITRIDDIEIRSARQLKEVVQQSDVGQPLSFEVRRSNIRMSLTVNPDDVHKFFD